MPLSLALRCEAMEDFQVFFKRAAVPRRSDEGEEEEFQVPNICSLRGA